MALPQQKQPFDAAAYLAWEAGQAERNEYVAGEVFAMVGVRQSHNVATLNLAMALRSHLKGTSCRVFTESVKTRVEAADCFFYPDIAVTCDTRDRNTPEYISHPSLLVEVLSESTAAYDRGKKFAAYRKLESLQEYLLVDLDSRRLELFRRNPENHWVLYDYGAGESIELATLSISIPVDLVFEDTDEPSPNTATDSA